VEWRLRIPWAVTFGIDGRVSPRPGQLEDLDPPSHVPGAVVFGVHLTIEGERLLRATERLAALGERTAVS
jgi:hypothetical protein